MPDRHDRNTDSFARIPEETTSVEAPPAAAPPAVSAPPRPPPSLVHLNGDEMGRSYALAGDVSIGRLADCEIQLSGVGISRRHAQIKPIGDNRYVIKDLQSRNGTMVNGVPIEEHELDFGDRISVGGEAILLYTYYDKLNEELIKQQRLEAIGRLAGGVAHDFNNLLASILANSELLLARGLDKPLGESGAEFLHDIETAVQRAADLNRQLINVARQGRMREKPLNLAELVAEVVRLCKRTFGPQHEIGVDIDAAIGVIGDSSQLHQVLMNLFVNARDAMPDGGKLSVAAELVDGTGSVSLDPQGRYARIRVSDTGVGMSAEHCSRVFEPFFTTKELGRGTGLGLATAYGIVRAHGGDLQVTSEAGTGTTFSVFLPFMERERKSTRLPTFSKPSIKRGQKVGILLVDDDELCRKSTTHLLRETGYTVFTAENGAEAVALYAENRDKISVVLLDLLMPEMDGEHACKQLLVTNPGLKVVVMTGCGDGDKLRAVVDAGAHSVLRKPFNRKRLELVIWDSI